MKRDEDKKVSNFYMYMYNLLTQLINKHVNFINQLSFIEQRGQYRWYQCDIHLD